jgi:hypothetical protein
MKDDENIDPARGRLNAIQASEGSPLGFSIRRKLKLGAARLGILSADADDVETPAPTGRAQTLVTGTEDIAGQGEPGPATDASPQLAPTPPTAMAEHVVPIAPDRTVTTDNRKQTAQAKPESTPPRPARRKTDPPKHAPYTEVLADTTSVGGFELPERKKGTFLLPLRAILEIRAFADLTKQTQYAIVDQAVSEFIANAVDEMNEHQQQRMSELVKRHAYKARVSAEKRARGRAARGKKLDLATRWEPPEDGRMAHFARRVRSGQTDDSPDAPQDHPQQEQ